MHLLFQQCLSSSLLLGLPSLYSTLCSWKHHNTYAQFERHQHLQRFTVIWAIGPDIYRCIRSNHNRLGIYTEIQFIFWHSIVVFLCSVMLLDLVEFWVNSSPCGKHFFPNVVGASLPSFPGTEQIAHFATESTTDWGFFPFRFRTSPFSPRDLPESFVL